MAKRASQKSGVPKGAAKKPAVLLKKVADRKKNFKQGKHLWDRVQYPGIQKTYPTPELLWVACLEYFEWAESNPLHEQRAFHHRGKVVKTNLSKMRIKTIGALCLYLGISRTAWKNYRNRPEYAETVAAVEDYIREDRIAGATAELLNPNFVALLMGLHKKEDEPDDATPITPTFQVREAVDEVRVTEGKKDA